MRGALRDGWRFGINDCPAAAGGGDEPDAGGDLAPAQRDGGAPVVERQRLRRDDVEVAGGAGAVLREREALGEQRGVDRPGLQPGLLVEDAQHGEVVLDLLEAREHGLLVLGDGGVSPSAGGVGHASPITDDTGSFWFFDAANLELVVKVLDGGGFNGDFWVFYGALSNLEYIITVTDTEIQIEVKLSWALTWFEGAVKTAIIAELGKHFPEK